MQPKAGSYGLPRLSERPKLGIRRMALKSAMGEDKYRRL